MLADAPVVMQRHVAHSVAPGVGGAVRAARGGDDHGERVVREPAERRAVLAARRQPHQPALDALVHAQTVIVAGREEELAVCAIS